LQNFVPPSYRVVVAEDNAQIRELLRQQLIELGHTVVGEAGDGWDAVRVVARERPDVVVIDWGLPGQDGLAATASIVQTAPTAVVVISAYVAGGDPEADARDAGAHAFLAKPYLLEDLDEALEQAVRRFERSNNGRQRIADGPSA
jgi:two-component system, response regulator PdtaR